MKMTLQFRSIDRSINDRLRAYALRQGYTMNTTLKKAIDLLEKREKKNGDNTI